MNELRTRRLKLVPGTGLRLLYELCGFASLRETIPRKVAQAQRKIRISISQRFSWEPESAEQPFQFNPLPELKGEWGPNSERSCQDLGRAVEQESFSLN